jgi:predicted nucleic acid-binding protein
MRNMDVLIDTNILLDFLEDREPFHKAAELLLKQCEAKKTVGHISAQSIPDIFYILRKDYTTDERKEMLLGVCEIMNVVEIGRGKLVAALGNKDFDDIEDCLQAECAKAVGADYIITRNIGHFANSAVPAILPEDFLGKFEQES